MYMYIVCAQCSYTLYSIHDICRYQCVCIRLMYCTCTCIIVHVIHVHYRYMYMYMCVYVLDLMYILHMYIIDAYTCMLDYS